MEEGETAPLLSRKELRKQKLIEYLSAKGRLKMPNPRPYLRDNCRIENSFTPAIKVFQGKENKVSVETIRLERTKVENVANHATTRPARGPLAVSNKANVRGSILTGRINVRAQSSASDSEPTGKPLLTGLQSKSHLSPVSHSNTQSHSKVGRGSSASSVSAKPVSTRVSVCPITKTKTGLIPAVTQPRNTKCVLSQAAAKPADTTTTTSKKLHSSMSATGSLKSLPSLKKTPHTTALNNHVHKKTGSSTMVTGSKIPPPNKSNAKPLLDERCLLSRKGHLHSEPKSLPSFTGRAAPVKPVSRRGTTSLVGKSTDGSAQQKSDTGLQRNGQTYKACTHTSSGPASRGSFPADRRVWHSVAIKLEERNKTSKETQSKKGQRSCSEFNAPPPQSGLNKPAARVMSGGASQPVPSTCHKDLPTGTKTPNVSVRIRPQTEGKKLTAAQEERMRKLQEWRQSKGISYKRPPMPVKPQVRRTVAVPQPFWTAMKEEDDAHALISAIDTSLADCIKLLREGCRPEQVKEVLSRLPTVSRKFAKYWICQVRLLELEGNLDVLPVFEEAVGVVLEPVDELRTVVFEILKRKDEFQETKQDQLPSGGSPEGSPESSSDPIVTPKPVRVLISGEKGNSSVVKYKITGTPGGPSRQKRLPTRVNGQEVRFFTPVRRSVRIEEASPRYPVSLQDHDLCVASYSDLISEEDKDSCGEQEDGGTSPSAVDPPMFIYRENKALKDKVLVQLVCD